MSDATIHPKKRRYSASDIIGAVAADLSKIKDEDGLCDKDLGRILGKSADQAEKYRKGHAEMSLSTFCFAWEAWGGRLVGSIRRMLDDDAEEVCPKHTQTLILHAALTLSAALEDGRLTIQEIAANRSTLENARDAIDAQLAKLKPRCVA